MPTNLFQLILLSGNWRGLQFTTESGTATLICLSNQPRPNQALYRCNAQAYLCCLSEPLRFYWTNLWTHPKIIPDTDFHLCNPPTPTPRTLERLCVIHNFWRVFSPVLKINNFFGSIISEFCSINFWYWNTDSQRRSLFNSSASFAAFCI